jgi:hypothetical protein
MDPPIARTLIATVERRDCGFRQATRSVGGHGGTNTKSATSQRYRTLDAGSRSAVRPRRWRRTGSAKALHFLRSLASARQYSAPGSLTPAVSWRSPLAETFSSFTFLIPSALSCCFRRYCVALLMFRDCLRRLAALHSAQLGGGLFRRVLHFSRDVLVYL